jgi:hypothetical protein
MGRSACQSRIPTRRPRGDARARPRHGLGSSAAGEFGVAVYRVSLDWEQQTGLLLVLIIVAILAAIAAALVVVF